MATPNVNPKMEYRRLGNTGLQVSVLSFGSWVTFDTQLDNTLATECIEAAGDAGCNFFDNAEAYAGGKSETIMGEVLREQIKDYRDLEKVIDHLPPELEAAGEEDFGNPAVMSADAMRSWLRARVAS